MEQLDYNILFRWFVGHGSRRMSLAGIRTPGSDVDRLSRDCEPLLDHEGSQTQGQTVLFTSG
jgi:hypothetical protein